MDRFVFSTLIVSASLVIGLTGCGDKAAKKPAGGDAAKGAAKDAHGHDHATNGPHGGSLIELGNEEYHAELVHDDVAKKVTIYILDGAAKASVPLDGPITINMKHDGKAEQFRLEPSPDTADTDGKSSRFVSSDAELLKDLDEEHAEAELAVSINGKPYRGKIEHHHEHEATK